MNAAARLWARSFSPYGTFAEVPPHLVRDALRLQFQRWGRPWRLRVDNGMPWGGWSDLPTLFALWSIGLDVQWHWNTPGRPTQNPKVERSQGTGQRWGDAASCRSVEQLQANLDEADWYHREKQRVTKLKKTRWEMFSGLKHSGRPYTLAWEARDWSLSLVKDHLSEYVAVRRVSSSGHVSVYDHGRYVGKQHRGQTVHVQFDPDLHAWLVSDAAGQALRSFEATEINRSEIHKMTFRTGGRKK
jgi:hypothetical protein